MSEQRPPDQGGWQPDAPPPPPPGYDPAPPAAPPPTPPAAAPPAWGQPQQQPPPAGPPAWGQQPPPPAGAPGWAPGEPAPPTGAGAPTPLAAVAIGAGVLAVLASFLTWATAEVSFDLFGQTGSESTTVKGTDGDGTITLVLGLVIAVLGALLLRKAAKGLSIGIVVAGALTALVGLINLLDLEGRTEDEIPAEARAFFEGDAFDLSVSAGIGLWLVLLAGLAAVAVGVVLLLRRPTA